MSTAAHRCPICRASLNFDSNSPAGSSVALGGMSPSIIINPPSAIPTAVINEGSEFISAQRLVPSSSLSSDMIRRTFGGRVLVALTTRHLQQTAGLGDDTAIRRFRITANSDSSVLLQPLEVHSLPPPLPAVRPAPQRISVIALEGDGGLRAGPGAQRRNIRHVVPSTSSAERDAQLHAVLDYWYPADQSNDAVTQTTQPTSSSSSSANSSYSLPSVASEVVLSCPCPVGDPTETHAIGSSLVVRRHGKRKRAVSGLIEPEGHLHPHGHGAVALIAAVARRSSRRLTSEGRRQN